MRAGCAARWPGLVGLQASCMWSHMAHSRHSDPLRSSPCSMRPLTALAGGGYCFSVCAGEWLVSHSGYGTAVMGYWPGGPGPARCDLVRRLGPHDQQSKQYLQLDRNVRRCRRCRNCLSIVMGPGPGYRAYYVPRSSRLPWKAGQEPASFGLRLCIPAPLARCRRRDR